MAKSFPDILINQFFDELDRLGYKPGTIAEITGIDRTTIFRIKKHERFPTKSMWIKLTKPFNFKFEINLNEKKKS